MRDIEKIKDLLIAEYDTLLFGNSQNTALLHCIDPKYAGKFNDQLRNISALREQVIVKVKYGGDIENGKI